MEAGRPLSLALIGLGFLITPAGYNWGLFQTLGTAVFLTLPVIRLSGWFRLGAGMALLAGYQLLLDGFWTNVVHRSVWGGIQATLSWSAMLILATAMADLFHNPRHGQKVHLWSAILSLALGILLSFWIPLSMHRASASYVLIGLGASGIVFAGFEWLSDRTQRRLPLLSAWGKNPEASVRLICVQASAFVGALSGLAWFLEQQKWHVSL